MTLQRPLSFSVRRAVPEDAATIARLHHFVLEISLPYLPLLHTHLYVLPAYHRRGIGSNLLRRAMRDNDALSLWVFQKNVAARQFYEQFGFALIRTTQGDNEEREPDALYRWTRPA